jgi:uracil-DNA glycosylase family 4
MSKEEAVQKLQDEIKKCSLCFTAERKKCLLGHGNISPRVMCVGEAPTLHLPAGQINIVFGNKSRPFYERFLAGIGETYESVWTTNCIKCAMVNEQLGDSRKCDALLDAEMLIIDPQYVVAFGNLACKIIAGGGPLDGGLVIKNGRRIVRMPHPMLAVYNPSKADDWDRLTQKVKDELEKKVWF